MTSVNKSTDLPSPEESQSVNDTNLQTNDDIKINKHTPRGRSRKHRDNKQHEKITSSIDNTTKIFGTKFENFFHILKISFHEPRFHELAEKSTLYKAMSAEDMWVLYRKEVWSHYDRLISIDNLSIGEHAHWKLASIFTFSNYTLHDMICSLSPPRQKILFEKLIALNRHGAKIEMVTQIGSMSIVNTILDNRNSNGEDSINNMMQTIILETMSNEEAMDNLCEKLQSFWTEDHLAYILTHVCGITPQQVQDLVTK